MHFAIRAPKCACNYMLQFYVAGNACIALTFFKGFYPISSDPVPKIFKLSSCKKAFGCIDFDTTLIEAA
jgi:hypothetical protein